MSEEELEALDPDPEEELSEGWVDNELTVYSTSAVAEMFECSQDAVLDWIRKDKSLRAFKVGPHWRVSRGALIDFIRGREVNRPEVDEEVPETV